MSIDLKGNTNYVAFHDLEQGLVVPRTNLSAVDMNVGNGLEVSGDTINIREADAIQIVNGASTNAVITSDALRKALFMGSTSILDVTKQTVAASAGSMTSTFDSDGMVVTGASANGVGGIKFVGPLAGMSEKEGKFLLVFDVYVSVNGSITSFSCTGDEGIVFETIPGYTLSKTEQGSWVRCAAIVDTTAGAYTGSLYFNVSTTSNSEYSFKLGNVRVQDATGLNSDEIQYLVLAGKINTTVDGATVVVDGNNQYVFIPGEGVKIQEGVISMDTSKAPAADLINNTGDMLLSNKNFNAALSSGKAVDVTSTPSASAGTVNTGIGIKGQISWSGSGNATFGFYDADHAFPKFAGGLVYLMEADVTNNGSSNITLSADNALNGTLPVTLAPGRKVRVAFLFDTATTGYFSLTSGGAFDIIFDYLREYEVTGCSDEARKYIAQLTDPDDYNKYYLVDDDEVNPWLYIINMHDAPVVTLMAGLAYKIHANDGNVHTLMVDTIPPNTYGRSAHLELYVGETSAIQLTSPLRLAHGNSFTANTLNNCSVVFQDGLATLTVDSVESSFIINLAGGTYTTESGTVYYGISTSESTYLVFNSDTNGLDADMHGAVANDDKEFYGNGIANTIMVGSGTFGTHKADIQELTLKGATISGSNINFLSNVGVQDALVNNGTVSVAANTTLKLVGATDSTAAISGAGKITFGNGAVVDASQNQTGGIVLGSANNTITVPASTTVSFKGLNGYSADIAGSTSGKYLLVDGSVTNSFYQVTTSNISGTGSFAELANSSEQYITFANSLDGVNISGSSIYVTRTIAIIGNGTDKTIIGGAPTAISTSNGRGISAMNLKITGSTDCICQTSYNSTWKLHNIVITGCTTTKSTPGVEAHNGDIHTYISNCVFSNNVGNENGAIRYNSTGTGDCYVTGTLFDNNSPKAVTCSSKIYFDGCTFKTATDSTYAVGGMITFSGSNTIINATMTASATGQYILTNSSLFNLSEHSNSKVITGGTITAESGAQVIPYGETEPVTVEGTGNTLLNTGKIGYLVGSTTGTAANSLYYGVVNTLYTNIIFDPVLNGSTVTLADLAEGTTYARGGTDVYIDGNGTTSTILAGSPVRRYTGTDPKLSFKNLQLRFAYGTTNSVPVYENCEITGITANSYMWSTGQSLGTIGKYINCHVHDSQISNVGWAYCVIADNADTGLINSVVESLPTTQNAIQFYGNGGTTESRIVMSGSTITNCGTSLIQILNTGSVTIENTTFDGCTGRNTGAWSGYFDPLTFIGVTGSTAVIKDCQFLTAADKITVPNGNGTGTTAPKLILEGTNKVKAQIHHDSVGALVVEITNNSVLDFTDNTYDVVISANTISIPGSVQIIKTDGSTVSISGPTTGTTLSNTGVLS